MAINLHKQAFSRLSSIIEDLKTQSKIIDKQNTEQHQNNSSLDLNAHNTYLFSNHLFKARSTKLIIYVNEINQKFIELKKHTKLNNPLIVNSLISLLEQQISALSNAIHSKKITQVNIKKTIQNKVREDAKKLASVKEGVASLTSLFQKLSEHNDFERRLEVMINERKNNNEKLHLGSQKHKQTQTEIVALQHRLSRCKNAIKVIEKEIRVAQQRYNSTI